MMAIDEVRIGCGPGEIRLGLFQGERAQGLRIFRQGWPVLGAVYAGRVTAVLKGLGAVLVETGHARPGFLEAKGLSEGQAVAVRVTAEPWAEKGAKLVFADEAALAGPAPDPLLAFLAGFGELEQVTVDDRALLARLRQAFPGWAERLAFVPAEGLDEAIEEALARSVPLPSGGRLMIDRTAALTALDVDTGSDFSPEARTRASLEAVQEIIRQICLRELAGRIVVDFAGLKRKALNQSVESLRVAAGQAKLPLQIGGVTPLGLVEMVRERGASPLADILLAPRPEAGWNAETAALSGLKAVLRRIEAEPGSRPRLALGREASALLAGKLAPAKAEAEARLGHRLEIIDEDRQGWEVLT